MTSHILVVLALSCALFAVPASAQSTAAPPAGAPQGGSAGPPPGPKYGDWWLVNAREVTPRPAEWLLHLEGTGSIANQTGSVSGYQHQINVLSALRKRLVTNQAGLTLTIQEARVENEGDFKQTTARFFDLVYVNVSKTWNVVSAAILEKDEPKRVHKRWSVFEGVSRNLTLPKGRHFSLAAAGGYESELVEGEHGPETEQSPTVYAQNTFDTPVANRGLFTHHLELFYDLKDTNDFRVNWNVGLNMQLTPHFGMGPSFQVRYDNKPVSQIQTTDTMAVFGFTFK